LASKGFGCIVARSLRIAADPLLTRALKIGKIADGGMPPTYETTHWLPARFGKIIEGRQVRVRTSILNSRFATVI
jgi:hypothetical protein